MSELYSTIGTRSYENLLADPQGADVISIPCKPGNGDIKRGTVMYREATGLWSPAASGQISTSYMLAVLNEDVATGDSIVSGAVAEEAAAFRAGRFLNGKVKLASNGTVTEAHKIILRMQGIVFDQPDGADGFQNGSVTITYVANNSASPAEDDVVNAAMYGESYTILGNGGTGGTGFTAPATKSFSKWNTKADGSGTDYAAAASYTAEADLKLYAVWA